MPKNKRAPTLKQVVHPNSRKAKQVVRQELRSKKLHKKAKQRQAKDLPLLHKLQFFRDRLLPTSSCFSGPELHEVVHQYVQQLPEDSEERRLYEKGAGVAVPNLKNGKVVKFLRTFTDNELPVAKSVVTMIQVLREDVERDRAHEDMVVA